MLVVLTWFFACAAGNGLQEDRRPANLYPLPFVYGEVWPGALAPDRLLDRRLVRHGRQLQRHDLRRQPAVVLAGPGRLPAANPRPRPCPRGARPIVSILFWSLVVAGFVVWGYFNEAAVVVAVLTCNLTALVWYVLAMVCLFVAAA